jgi:hypothetical protein
MLLRHKKPSRQIAKQSATSEVEFQELPEHSCRTPKTLNLRAISATPSRKMPLTY